MFCVIYEFEVVQGREVEFKNIWHQLTIEIKENSGGLGSRLHQVVDQSNLYIAYAQWPTQSAWKASAPLNVRNQADLTKRMKEVCTRIDIVYQLNMIDDLFIR